MHGRVDVRAHALVRDGEYGRVVFGEGAIALGAQVELVRDASPTSLQRAQRALQDQQAYQALPAHQAYQAQRAQQAEHSHCA